MAYDRLSPGIYHNTETGGIERMASVPAGAQVVRRDAAPAPLQAAPAAMPDAALDSAYKGLLAPLMGTSHNSSFAERMRGRIGNGVNDGWNARLYLTPEQLAAHQAYVAANPGVFDAEAQAAMDEQVKRARTMAFGRW